MRRRHTRSVAPSSRPHLRSAAAGSSHSRSVAPLGAAGCGLASPTRSLIPTLERTGWRIAVALLVLSFGFTAMVNSDIWFHLAAGELILDSGAVPRVDAWSYTAAGRPWHNHEWLADVIYAAWQRAFGLQALVVWEWILLLAAFLGLFEVMRRLGARDWIAFTILVWTLALAAPLFDIRPHLYTLFGTVLVVGLGMVRERLPLWTPLAIALWANLHAGALFGWGALTLLVGVRWICEGRAAWSSPAVRREGLVIGLSAIALCATPFGVGAVTYPLALLQADSPSRVEIAEWTSPFVAGPLRVSLLPAALALAAASVVVLLASASSRRDVRTYAALALAVVTLAMAVQSRRFVELFAIAHAVLLALAAASLLRRRASRLRPSSAVHPALRLLPAILAAVFALVRLQPYPFGTHAFGPTVRVGTMPVETMRFAEVNELEGEVFSWFLWGGYVLWRTDGQLRVFLDPRSDTVFPPAVQSAYYRVQRLEPGWQEIIEGSGADYVLWPRGGAWEQQVIVPLADSGRWRRLYEDAVSVLLVRSDLDPLVRRVTPPSPFRTWALARQAEEAGDLRGAAELAASALAGDPALVQACDDLVRIRALLGETAGAAAQLGRCDAILPHPGRTAMFRQLRAATTI